MDLTVVTDALKQERDHGDPKYAKLELGCGVPHRLGGAPRSCGV